MKNYMGCAAFLVLLGGAGIFLFKYAQRRGMTDATFREDTPRGVCECFVKAMAEGDWRGMQQYADDDLKTECGALIDRFNARVKGAVQGYQSSFESGSRDHVRVRVLIPGLYYDITLWVHTVGGEAVVGACNF